VDQRSFTEQNIRMAGLIRAFTLGYRKSRARSSYIHNQEHHHAKKNFDAEFHLILRKHGLDQRTQSSPAGDFIAP
jgi:hypothetical protein